MKLYCLLHGHDDLLVFPEGCLECQTCRRRTPGWHHETEVKREPFLERLGRIFALVVWAGIVWAGPKLTPQEAANILRPNQYVAPPTCDDCVGPYVAVMPNSTDTWGAFRLGEVFMLRERDRRDTYHVPLSPLREHRRNFAAAITPPRRKD